MTTTTDNAAANATSATQQAWAKFMADAHTHAQTVATQLQNIEAQMLAQFQVAIAHTAQLAQDAVAYSAKLSNDARELAANTLKNFRVGA